MRLTLARRRVFELQEPSSATYSDDTKAGFVERLDDLENRVRAELVAQGFAQERINVERLLNMRFAGTDTALMVPGPDFLESFKDAHRAQFGFVLDAAVGVDDAKVRGTGRTFDSLGKSVFAEVSKLERRAKRPKPDAQHSVYFDGVGRVQDTLVFVLDRLAVGDEVQGPAMIIDNTQTIVIIP